MCLKGYLNITMFVLLNVRMVDLVHSLMRARGASMLVKVLVAADWRRSAAVVVVVMKHEGIACMSAMF